MSRTVNFRRVCEKSTERGDKTITSPEDASRTGLRGRGGARPRSGRPRTATELQEQRQILLTPPSRQRGCIRAIRVLSPGADYWLTALQG